MALTLSELITESAEKYADRIFVIDRELYRRKSYTYGQIYSQAGSLCAFFAKKGISKGDKVVIYLPNSSDYASLLWACALSGVIAVPVDFNNTLDFAAKIYRITHAKMVFCSIFKTPDNCRKCYQEEINKIYDEYAGFNTERIAAPEDVFEIVYTSGTTAEPKGAILTHKNIAANVKSMEESIDFEIQHSSLLSILPLSHLFEQTAGFFFPSAYGASITYIQSRKSSAIIKAFREENIQIMVTVPLFLETIKEKIEFEAEKAGKLETLGKNLDRFSDYPLAVKKIMFSEIRSKLGKLKYLISGGAALDAETAIFWKNLGYDVLQGYGLTETSPVLTCNFIGKNKYGTVGMPLPGIEIKIAEDGEILAKGDNVFSGYYENPQETEKTLKKGWIYTGDLGNFDEDGFLKITGRKKNIIISPSGLNVYPEDIEKVLNHLDKVKDSAVIGLDGGKNLAGIILSDEKINAEALLKQANSRLMQHQYLSRIIQWPEEDFPRTTTRKIIRRKVEEKLNEMLAQKKEIKKEPIKDPLVKMLSEVLETSPKKIAEKTLLKDMGLDSLKRIDLAVKIEEVYDLEEFNEDEITEKTKVRDLRKIIEQSKGYKPESGISPLNSDIFDFARFGFQESTFFISSILYSREVKGIENLALIPKNQPVIFIANHTSILDSFSIFKSLPLRCRLNLHPAGAKDFFFEGENRGLGIIGRIGFNVFSFSRTSGIKQSLRDFGEIINRGGNILIYPEGTRSYTGELMPFKLGIGLIAWHMQVPVVPIKLEGLHHILPRGRIMPKSGHVKVIIGKPIKFSKMQSFGEISDILHKELEKLK